MEATPTGSLKDAQSPVAQALKSLFVSVIILSHGLVESHVSLMRQLFIFEPAAILHVTGLENPEKEVG